MSGRSRRIANLMNRCKGVLKDELVRAGLALGQPRWEVFVQTPLRPPTRIRCFADEAAARALAARRVAAYERHGFSIEGAAVCWGGHLVAHLYVERVN